MATGESTQHSMVDDLEEEITCSVCQEHFQDPKILPCCHYYCKRCIQALIETAGKNKPFPCPECRSDTFLQDNNPDKLPTAFFVNRMKDIHSKTAKVSGKIKARCEQCSEQEAIAFCRQCTEFICERCFEAHKKMKAFSGHRVTTLEELKEGQMKQIPIEQPSPPICSIHEEQMKLFCFNCKHLICRDCTVIDHKDHSCDFVKKIAPGIKENLSQKLVPIKRMQLNASSALKAVESTKSDIETTGAKVTAIIKSSFQNLHDIIEQRKLELLVQVSKFMDTKFDRLCIQEKELQTTSNATQSVIEFVERNVRNMSDEELVAIHLQILKQISGETEKFGDTSLKPVEEADMVFNIDCVAEIRRLCGENITLIASAKRKVVWVDPRIGNFENSNYVHYLKAVEGVNLYATTSSSDALAVLIKQESDVEYRAITAGTGGEDFIKSLRKNGIHCPVLVFCGNFDWHSKWARKFNNVQVTVDPSIMYEFASWDRL